MATFVDGSLFTPVNPEIDYWDDIMAGTLVGGISVYAVTSWVMGHVVMSVGAPLVVVEALLPDGRDRPWLGRVGLLVLVVLGCGVAVLIHSDGGEGGVEASALDHVVAGVVVLALVAVAMSPVGRPLSVVEGRRPGGPLVLGVAGFGLMAAFDLVPMSWMGVVLAWGVLVAAGVVVAVRSRSTDWTWRHLAAFAFGGVLARTLIGIPCSRCRTGSNWPRSSRRTSSSSSWCSAWAHCCGCVPASRMRACRMRPMTERSPRPRRDEYVVWRQATTRWADDDVYGHMNNARYFELIDTAVNAHLAEATGVDIRSLPAIGVVAEVGCRYFREMGYPAPVDMGMVVDKVGTSSVVYRIGLFQGDPEGDGAEAAAEGRFVHVYVDNAGSGRRVSPLPEQIREAVVPLLRA